MKKHLLSISVFTCIVAIATAQNFKINTYAGNGTFGYSGDGGQATAAELSNTQGLFYDASGNLYLSDQWNYCVRMIDASGIITTIAGNGTSGYSGDGGQATAAELNEPIEVCKDSHGNIYITDLNNQVIREINSSGIINTFAGNGTVGYSGDGGQATAAELNNPTSLCTDGTGNLYIADYGNGSIRMVNTNGIITTIVGNGNRGFSGDGGQATAAELSSPNGLAFDASGNFYIADAGNNRIRKVNTGGIISTVAGNGTGGFSGDGGQATAAEIYFPAALCFDALQNLYIADVNNNCIRMVNTSGQISTIAGDTTPGFSGDGGPATAAELKMPTGICSSVSGNLYIADFNNYRIRILKDVTGFAEVESNTLCKVFPNPSAGVFYLQTNFSTGGNVEVYDMLGNKVYAKQISKGNLHAIDLSQQQSGIYLYRVTDNYGEPAGQGKLVLAQ